jgi:hypothetical protein
VSSSPFITVLSALLKERILVQRFQIILHIVRAYAIVGREQVRLMLASGHQVEQQIPPLSGLHCGTRCQSSSRRANRKKRLAGGLGADRAGCGKRTFAPDFCASYVIVLATLAPRCVILGYR